MSSRPERLAGDLRERAEALLTLKPDEKMPPERMADIQSLAHELAVHQTELELQNEELRDAQSQLYRSRDRFAALFQQAPAGYVILDRSGLVCSANETWCRMLGRSQTSVIGKPFAETLVDEDARMFRSRFRTFLQQPEGKRFLVQMKRQDGGHFPAQIQGGLCPAVEPAGKSDPGEQQDLMVIVSDVSDLHEAKRELEARHEQLQILNLQTARLNSILRAIREINQLINKVSEPQELIHRACRSLTSTLSYTAAWIAVFEDGRLLAAAQDGLSDVFDDLHELLRSGSYPACMQKALQMGEVQVFQHPRLECGDCPLSDCFEEDAKLVCPLTFEGQTQGVLTVAIPRDFASDQEELNLLHELSEELGGALHTLALERRLQTVHRRYAALFDNNRDGFVMVGLDGAILDANAAFCKLTGYSLDALKGLRHVRHLSPPQVQARYAGSAWFEHVVGKASGLYQQDLLRRDGITVPVEIEWSAVRDEDGDLCFVWGTVRDVSRYEEAQQALRKSEQLMRAILATTPDGFWLLDAEGTICDVNDACSTLTGYPRDALLGLQLDELEQELTPGALRSRLHRVRRHGASFYEAEVRCRNGQTLPLEISMSYLEEHGGRFVCFCRDLRERQQREARIQMLGHMLDQAPAAIMIHSLAGDILYANQHTLHLHGYPDEQEFLSLNLADLDGPADRMAIKERTALVTSLGEHRFEVSHFRRDGSIVPLEVLAKMTRWQGAEAILSIGTDISERKESEKELRRREQLLQRVFEVIPVGLWLTDRQGKLIRSNPAGRQIWGGEPEAGPNEYGGFKAFRLPNREPIEADEWALAKTVRTGSSTEDELLEIQTFDGKLKTILNFTAPVLDDQGKLDGAICVNLDVSDRQALETQLAQAQKMESVGRLAGGVAHDFNNMLGVILGRAEMAMARLPEYSPIRSDLEDIMKAGRRSADLTRQLLAFARKQTVAPKQLDLNQTITSVLKMLRRLVGEDIALVWEPGRVDDRVLIDPVQIDQLLANLVINARDAIGKPPGSIRITTRQLTVSEADEAAWAELTPGSWIEVAVSDDGCGMDNETREQIFEPFFTTKGVGKGTGLGLATVYGIVKQNDGAIRVDSSPEQGTTFRLYLAAHPAAADELPEVEEQAAVQTAQETVLLVEDEPAILNLTREMLEEMGFRVIATHHPTKAISLADSHAGTIDLVVTDIVMPSLNGRELLDILKRDRPDMKGLMISGYTADSIAERGVEEGIYEFLQKPFSFSQLAAKVQDVLGK